MAVNRTVLLNGTVQPQHNTPYETDLDANAALADQWQGGRVVADLGINGVANGLVLATSASLTPGLSLGVLYAQGRRIPVSSSPGMAPNNATNYLFYNSSSGFYYQASAVAAAAGDVLIGNVTASGGQITAVVQGTKIHSALALAPANPGNFTLQHYLGRAPVGALIRMTSAGAVWWQTSKWDATNLYLVASDSGLTAEVELW